MNSTRKRDKLHGGMRHADSILTCRTIDNGGGAPLHYFVAGNALQTMVIINAYGQSSAFWEPAAGLLTDSYRIVILQPRGTDPDSGLMQAAYPVAQHVRDMEAVFSAEAIGAAHLVGWHTALKTALHYYAANRLSVASMSFLSASAFHTVGSELLHSRYEAAMFRLSRIVARQPQLAHHVVDLLRDLLSAWPSRDNDGSATEPDIDDPNRIAQIKSLALEPFRTPGSVVQYAQQLIAYWESDVTPILPEIDVPVLFIGGDADHITTMKAVKATAAHVPNSIWIKVRGGTHYMQCDQHRLVAGILAGFVEKGWSFDGGHPGITFGHGMHTPVPRTRQHATQTGTRVLSPILMPGTGDAA